MEPRETPVRRQPPPTPVLAGIVVGLVALTVLVGAVWVVPALTRGAAPPGPSSGPSASAIAVASSMPSASASLGPSIRPSPGATAPLPASTTVPGGPFATAGSIAVVGNDGSLSVVDAAGRSVGLAGASDAALGFPAWSPDGSRIAAIRLGIDNSVLVFDARAAAAGHAAKPVEIFRSSVDGPFYLSWTPDGRKVSFLTDSPDGLSLRLAPADGSAPLDGSGPGAKVRSGNPLYYDWIDADRLFAHIGTGPFAFLGEIELEGASAPSAPPDLTAPGDFRAVVVSHDRAYVSYVRAGSGGSADVVVAKRDGSSERTMPVFGVAAVAFDPIGDTVASIGPTKALRTPYAIPLGPLRLIDAASGKVRTLLDGSVVSFWWSPDGKTIAALRVQPVGGTTASSSPGASSSPAASPSEQPTEVRLLFVDVASGEITSQRVVQPASQFIGQFLSYFDQYALSHRLWAPDSSSILMPVNDRDGTPRIAVLFRNGDQPRSIEGAIGFWSP